MQPMTPTLIPVEKVPISKLFIDTSYQRVPNSKRVMRIVANFDVHAFQVLEVSLRSDGRYAVFDGGHKLSAARIIGFEYLYCRVHSGLSVADEAAYFNMLQTERKRLTQIEMFTADVIREYEPALRVKEIIESEGYRLDSRPDDGSITFVKGLYRADSLGVLRLQLRAMREAWGIPTGACAVTSVNFVRLTTFIAAIPQPLNESALIASLGRNQYVPNYAPRLLMERYLEAVDEDDIPQREVEHRATPAPVLVESAGSRVAAYRATRKQTHRARAAELGIAL
jgi:hypothetical protein